MSIQIQIPTPLRSFTASQAEVSVVATTVGDAVQCLVDAHPQLQPHLFTDEGKLRSFVNLFLNDEDVRFLDKLDTALSAGDTLTIIPSIAGGATRPSR